MTAGAGMGQPFRGPVPLGLGMATRRDLGIERVEKGMGEGAPRALLHRTCWFFAPGRFRRLRSLPSN